MYGTGGFICWLLLFRKEGPQPQSHHAYHATGGISCATADEPSGAKGVLVCKGAQIRSSFQFKHPYTPFQFKEPYSPLYCMAVLISTFWVSTFFPWFEPYRICQACSHTGVSQLKRTSCSHHACGVLSKAFLAILLMASWIEAPSFMGRCNDVIELFAGTARVCRVAQAAGHYAIAHDMLFDKSGSARSAMDMNGSGGFSLLG